ncbi:MAG: hypothetical protein M1144_01030 [Candidatus Thermoplasmatota archaeon]|nr:hypothetical protein [Candidatus Thermoplasmatota archaeon]
MATVSSKLLCPFCGREEAEREMIEGKRLIVFPCMFSPLVELSVPEDALQEHLNSTYGKDPAYFRRQCDRLHLAVVKAPA